MSWSLSRARWIESLEEREEAKVSIVTLLSILAGDGIAVPLSPGFPVVELRYIMENSGADVLIATERFAEKAREVVHGSGIELVIRSGTRSVEPVQTQSSGLDISLDTDVTLDNVHGGMMLYTSGTTSRPVRVMNYSHCTYVHDCSNRHRKVFSFLNLR